MSWHHQESFPPISYLETFMSELNDLIVKRIERCLTLNDVDNAHEYICRLVKVKNRRNYIDKLVEKEMIIREQEGSSD